MNRPNQTKHGGAGNRVVVTRGVGVWGEGEMDKEGQLYGGDEWRWFSC